MSGGPKPRRARRGRPLPSPPAPRDGDASETAGWLLGRMIEIAIGVNFGRQLVDLLGRVAQQAMTKRDLAIEIERGAFDTLIRRADEGDATARESVRLLTVDRAIRAAFTARRLALRMEAPS